jgi:hypothetical protein
MERGQVPSSNNAHRQVDAPAPISSVHHRLQRKQTLASHLRVFGDLRRQPQKSEAAEAGCFAVQLPLAVPSETAMFPADSISLRVGYGPAEDCDETCLR